MNAETAAPKPAKPSPYDRKLSRLQNARAAAQTELVTVTARRAAAVVDTEKAKTDADLALLHVQEDAASAEERERELNQKCDRLLIELEAVRMQLVEIGARRAEIKRSLGDAQQHQAECDLALADAGRPFDAWIAALTDDVKKYDYRIEQHVARGPGSTALYIGVKG